MKKILVAGLSLLLTAACTCKELPSKKSLRLNIADDPVSLDPRLVRSIKDLTLVLQLYDGLTRLDQDGKPTNALAEEIQVSEDLLTYTFHLRKAYWSNGDPVTAYDFEYAWLKLLDPTFGADYSYMLFPIKNARLAREGKTAMDTVGIAALDEKTLVVQLEAPVSYFLELTAFPTYFPTNYKIAMTGKKYPDVFNGPFKLKSWKTSEKLLFEKNPNYWDCKNVFLDHLIFSIIPDANTQFYLFEKNELDWLGQPISSALSSELAIKMRENGMLRSYPVAGTFWIQFNCKNMPFDKPKLRKAFSMAIDRKAIVDHILLGSQKIATALLPPAMSVNASYFEDSNLLFAKQMFEECLEENGWSIKDFPKIVVNFPNTERISKIMQLIQQQWKDILGVEVRLEAMEYQFYLRNLRQGTFQMGTGEWIADFNDPLAFLEFFKYSGNSKEAKGMNDTGWNDVGYTKTLDCLLIENDPVKRRQLILEAEAILRESMPIAPIYHYSFEYVIKKNIRDVILSPLGTADFKFAKIEE